MGFNRIGMDFLGGGMEGAGAGATVAAGLTAAGMATPYAPLLIGGMAAGGALTRILGGLADKPAEGMQMRLGKQQIQMNDLQIEAQRRASQEERRALMKNRALQDAVSKIFGRYQALGKGGV